MDLLYPRYGHITVVPNWQTYLSLHPGIEGEILNIWTRYKQDVDQGSCGRVKSMKSF
jgi:hypothetical protein